MRFEKRRLRKEDDNWREYGKWNLYDSKETVDEMTEEKKKKRRVVDERP